MNFDALCLVQLIVQLIVKIKDKMEEFLDMLLANKRATDC